MFKKTFILPLKMLFILLAFTSCSEWMMDKRPLPLPHAINNNSENTPYASIWQESPNSIWYTLSALSLTTLQQISTTTTDTNKLAWINLSIISKQYSNRPDLIFQLQAWQKSNPKHVANSLLPANSILLENKEPEHIAVLLPLQGMFAPLGQIVRDGFLNSYYASLNTLYHPTITFYDTSTKPIPALYEEALVNGADFIVGPLTKEEVQQLLTIGNYKVTTLALNYTTTNHRSLLPNNLYEFGLRPLDEIEQIVNKALSMRHKNALIIALNDPKTIFLTNELKKNWQAQGGLVVEQFYFDNETNLNAAISNFLHVDLLKDRQAMKKENNKELLEQQRRQDFDVLFLLAPPEKAREIVPLLKFYYADNIPIYSTSMIFSGKVHSEKDSDLDGVIFCDIPWILNLAHDAKKNKAIYYNRLFALGQDAYLLSKTWQRFEALPYFPLQGTTGNLWLTNDHTIYRSLPFAKFQNGIP